MKPRHFSTAITYFLQEGRENLRECIKIAFHAAKEHNIRRLVIFTAYGEGIRVALEEFCSQDEYKDVSIVGVTFPQGMEFTGPDKKRIEVAITPENLSLFAAHAVPIIRAHMPFDPIGATFKERGVLGQDLSLVGNALSMFGGSMSLCVQSVLLACDAGEIGLGEHVISLTSDTAILAQATCTNRMLTDLVIREVLCKPAILTIGRKEDVEQFLREPASPKVVDAEEVKALPKANKQLDSTK